MKLSELKGEAAIVAIADIIEPAAELMKDKEVVELAKSGKTIKFAVSILRNHPKVIIKILAALNQSTPEEFADKITLTSLPKMLMELVQDSDLMDLFKSQGQTGAAKSSGSVSASAEM